MSRPRGQKILGGVRPGMAAWLTRSVAVGPVEGNIGKSSVALLPGNKDERVVR